MKVTLMEAPNDALFLISACARTCYQSEDKDEVATRETFAKGLIKRKHFTPLEFCWTIWDIRDISRVCLAQLTRHRIATYCVQSHRYTNALQNSVVEPISALKIDDSIHDLIKDCQKKYQQLINNGVPKEDARYILPMGTTCNLKMGMNFRSLRNFLSLRLDKHAQWEIRELAKTIRDICNERWPWLVEDLEA